MCRREPSLCEGESTQHRVSSDKLKILLQPPRGCCLARQTWQGSLLLRDLPFRSIAAKRPEGHRKERVPQLRKGDGAYAGGPQYFPAVSQLSCTSPRYSGGCSLSAGRPFQNRCGHRGPGSGTLRSLQRGLGGQWATERGPWDHAGEGSPPSSWHGGPPLPQPLPACRTLPHASFPCTALSQPFAA